MEKNLRRSGSILLTVLIFFFLGFAMWRSSAESSAAAQVAQASQFIRTSKTPTPGSPQAPDSAALVVAPPGSQLYVAKRGDSITSVAHRYLSQTSYLTSGALAEAIRMLNGEPRTVFLKTGQQVVIPGILDAPIVEKAIPVARDFEVRAVYLTGVMAASDRGLRIIRRWRELGGNAVVFDVKDSDGSINIAFDHPLAGSHHAPIHDLPKFTRFLHSQGMHAIARVAIFRDERLVVTHPELAVKSKRSGQAWRENGKLVWTDPSQPKVQDYDIALAKYVAQLGADEIQFDYVRFPAEGDQKDASFAFQAGSASSAQGSSEPSAAERVPGPCGDGPLGRPTEAKQGGTSTAVESSDSLCTIPAANANSDTAPKGRKKAAHGASPGIAAENDQAPEARQKKPSRSVAAAK